MVENNKNSKNNKSNNKITNEKKNETNNETNNEIKNEKKIPIKIKNEKVGKEISEFKKFIMRGNIVDMAVGVIIGSAFSSIVTSLVNDILMPVIGVFLGGVDFTSLKVTILNDATINYGMFIQNIINFLIIAVSIFIFLKLVTKIFAKFKEVPKEEPKKKPDDILLLEEIRDLLKEQSGKNG